MDRTATARPQLLRTAEPTAAVPSSRRRYGGEVPDLVVSRPTLEDTYLRWWASSERRREPRGPGLRSACAAYGSSCSQFARDREAAFFTMLLPVLLLVVFGSAFRATWRRASRSRQYFIAGMIASGIVYTSFQNLAIAIPQERDDGTLKRLQGTPMPQGRVLPGQGRPGPGRLRRAGGLDGCHRRRAVRREPARPTAADWLTFGWLSVLGLATCTLLGIAFSHCRAAVAAPPPW